MKHFYILSIAVTFTCAAHAAPTRFKIKNQVSGLEFQVERPDDVMPELQPEWGKPEHELPCTDVAEAEATLIKARRMEPATDVKPEIEMCLVGDHFLVVKEDLSAEIAASLAAENAKRAALARLKAVDFSKVTTVAQLKSIVQDILEANK